MTTEKNTKTVLITGATSGIGEEFARRFAKMGCSLILTGRRTERLKIISDELTEKYHISVRTITADLSHEEECIRLIDRISSEKIDVFINNAGFGTCGPFTETDLTKEINMIRVNDMAMHILFKKMLILMKQADHGMILNVASSAGLLPGGPYMACYYATKAYMVSLTRAVAQELKESGSHIYVGALCPGPVDTEFNQNADVRFALKGITPQKCVRDALKGMKKRKTIIIPSFGLALGLPLLRFLPMSLVMDMTGKQQKKKFTIK